MTDIPIEQIRRLKSLTGVGITGAKKALEEASGDFDKALAAMRQKGLTQAERRAEREVRAGLVGTYSHDGRIGVVVEVNCESDFVAKTDEFKELVKDLLLHIAAMNPPNPEGLMKQPFVKDPDQLVGDYIKEHIARLGENIVVRRFSRIELGETGP